MRQRTALLSAVLALLPRLALAQAAPEPDPPKEAAPEPQAPAAEPTAGEPDVAPEGTTDQKAEAAAAGSTKAKSVVQMDDGAVDATAEADAQAGVAGTGAATRRGPSIGSEEWKFDFHGYFRAPMRVGIGKRDVAAPELEVDGASSTTLHAPIIPDDQFLSFQSTPHNKKDWAELFFTLGNSWASGTVSIQGYNFAEAAWNDANTQFGISQAYVNLTPDLGYENVRLALKAGAFSDKYGQAGRYDAGEYDTYLFGRTHIAGETLHIDFDLDEANTLYIEHGVGTKRPDPSQFNNARFTVLNHLHAGLKQGRDLEIGAHYMVAWTQEDDRDFEPTASSFASSRSGLPDGKLWVAGIEGRAELGALGYLYAGYSHIGAEYAVTVAPAIEVLHAFGGGQFQLGLTDNYLDSPGCAGTVHPDAPAPPVPANGAVVPDNWGIHPNGCSDGNGSVNAISAQYEFSLANFMQQSSGGQRFWGEGEDVKLALYGIYAAVNSDALDTTTDQGLTGTLPTEYSVTKVKFGADLQYAALPWLTGAIRLDRVQPNSNIPEQSFGVLSPRVVFKSKWVTREQISFQYSRYFYDQRTCGEMDTLPFRCVQAPPAPVPYEGFGSAFDAQDTGNRAVGPQSTGRAGVFRPDVNVFKIEASMWW
ncbi:MAG TPA: hypothetical protein VM686_12320 [Polyangiaceae bacterium]|nr:hypothetical protein [Polyangiaceae bacterium]